MTLWFMVFSMNYEVLTEKKQQLDRFRPLPKVLVRNLEDWFRVELTYNSNAIEGNTLTRRETALVVEKGLTVGGRSLVEHLEATNHAYALDWVQEQVNRKPSSLKQRDILQIHNMILRGIDDTHAGCYRTVAVRISGPTVVLANPIKVPDLMTEFIKWIKKADEIHPIDLAAEAHYRLVSIHPFVDGNGRTARLMMNMILLMAGYPPAIIAKRERLAYITALEKAQTGGSKDNYLKLIAKAVNRSLDIYLKAAQGESAVIDYDTKLLKIGELARRVSENNSTIRYWTKQGLLEIAEVTESGYQLYASDMIKRVAQIHAMKKKRLTLQEIKKKFYEG